MKSYSLRGYKIAAGKRKAKLNRMGFERTIWVPQRILDDIFEAIKDNAVTDARVEFRLEQIEQEQCEIELRHCYYSDCYQV